MSLQARLHEVLNYDQETGVFTWKPRKGCRAGQPLGCDNGNGYLRITVDGVSHYAHRLAWVYMNGSTDAEHIDHINGNRADNRIANLRPATPKQNQENRHGAQRNSKSGVLGVSWHKRAGKWQAHRSGEYLGLYPTQEAAQAAYMEAANV
jgi:hypothetical protein